MGMFGFCLPTFEQLLVAANRAEEKIGITEDAIIDHDHGANAIHETFNYPRL